MKKKLLLHTCCAPCSTHCVKELLADYDVVMYFYNPNVHPYGEYIVDDWLGHIAGFEEEPEGGKRCGICFSIRLKRTAEYAKKNGFDCFTTTLSISPHKNSDVINSLGEELAKKHGVSWVHSDFKKKDGFKRSSEMSKKIGLYRQKYCGCFYSVKI
jgi:predicted adenine nucleotide alpha hydrolase (AANH) superfamily ATPase